MASLSHTKKRSAYDASFKLEVVGYAEIHGNRAASREFTVPETNVRDWKKKKVVLKGMKKQRKHDEGNKPCTQIWRRSFMIG